MIHGAGVGRRPAVSEFWMGMATDVAGSGLVFEERGAHALKGVPGEWRLYAVTRTA